MAGPTYNTKAGQGKVTFEVDPITLRAMLKTIGKLDKDVQNEIRDNSQKLSLNLKDDLTRAALTSRTPVAKRLVMTITTPRDRLPTVKIGGSKKVGKPYKDRATGKTVKASAGALLWGSEHGGFSGFPDRSGRNMGNRFKAPRNENGYWIYPTVDHWGTYLFMKWSEMVDDILRREGIRG